MWEDKIYQFANKNKIDGIIKKINILMEAKDSIKFNVNSNLLMDSVVINIGGV